VRGVEVEDGSDSHGREKAFRFVALRYEEAPKPADEVEHYQLFATLRRTTLATARLRRSRICPRRDTRRGVSEAGPASACVPRAGVVPDPAASRPGNFARPRIDLCAQAWRAWK